MVLAVVELTGCEVTSLTDCASYFGVYPISNGEALFVITVRLEFWASTFPGVRCVAQDGHVFCVGSLQPLVVSGPLRAEYGLGLS